MAKNDEARKFGAQGGKARAKRLTPEERSDIARAGALAKWKKEGVKVKATPVALYGSADKPLRIANVTMPCYVLDDGRRVVAQRGLKEAIGMSMSGGTAGAQRVARFVESLAAKGVDTKDLVMSINTPILFRAPRRGKIAYGYEATLIPDLCAVIWEAYEMGLLHYQQEHLAIQCNALVHALAKTGITALVDEATGYQEFRARDALAVIMEKFIAKELRPWVRTFPAQYYEEIFRLRGWGAYKDGKGSPGVVAYWTNDIVYRRLAPKVLEELQARTPRTDTGRLKNRMFQWLTDDHGHPRLREHLAGVVMLMKYAPNWNEFMRRLDVEYTRFDETLPIPFPEATVREANSPTVDPVSQPILLPSSR